MSFAQGPDNLLPYEIYGMLRIDRTVRDRLPFTYSGEVPLSMTTQ